MNRGALLKAPLLKPPDAGVAVLPRLKLNRLIFCGLPPSRTVKSSAVRSSTGSPLLSVATTSTTTRRVVALSTVAEGEADDAACGAEGC